MPSAHVTGPWGETSHCDYSVWVRRPDRLVASFEWAAAGLDLDAHPLGPGADREAGWFTEADVYYLHRSRDWGAPGVQWDDPMLAYDDTAGPDTETIVTEDPVDGTYPLAAHAHCLRDAVPMAATLRVRCEGAELPPLEHFFSATGQLWWPPPSPCQGACSRPWSGSSTPPEDATADALVGSRGRTGTTSIPLREVDVHTRRGVDYIRPQTPAGPSNLVSFDRGARMS